MGQSERVAEAIAEATKIPITDKIGSPRAKSEKTRRSEPIQIEYLARISLPDEGWDVSMLEEACWKASREAGQELFISAFGATG